MIQRLQNSNINFKSTQLSPALQATLSAKQDTAEIQEEPKKKFSVKETYASAKKGITNAIKGFNNVASVGEGFAKGLVGGAVATGAVGVVGKAISEAKDLKGLKVLGHIITQSVTDTAKGAWGAVKFVPSIITKSPLENLKTIGSLPKKFYTTYLKGHKGIAGLATAVGLGILAFNTIHGKVKANQKNADLDHKTNQGHV